MDGKVFKVYLPLTQLETEIHVFADLHIGDPLCDMSDIKSKIEIVKNNPNALVILNGDILNNAIATSCSDSYGETLSPMEEVKKAAELFEPIKDRIIAIVNGNHEDRTYKQTGVDLTQVMALQLGLNDKYSPTSAVVIVRLGKSKKQGHNRQQWYSMYITHGRGGGAKPGSKINKLVEMEAIIDTDIYVHAHTHMPAIVKQGYNRLDVINGAVTPVEKLFVNTAAELDYGGYGQAAGFKPASKSSPIIFLSGTQKRMTAKV